MSKLIIWVPGRPIIYSYARGDFKWSEAHKCFIYMGRELDEKEFNAVIDKVMSRNEDKNPSVRVILPDAVTPAAYAVPEDEVPDDSRRAQESEGVALQRAIDVVRHLAPDRLKKPPSRRAVVPA